MPTTTPTERSTQPATAAPDSIVTLCAHVMALGRRMRRPQGGSALPPVQLQLRSSIGRLGADERARLLDAGALLARLLEQPPLPAGASATPAAGTMAAAGTGPARQA